MAVPMLDLKAQYGPLREEIIASVTEVLDSQWCVGGPKVTELEEKVAALSDCKFGVGASSGTDAILNSMMSLGIGKGDEVITTTFTFFATAGCIVRSGATPVFVDIDPKTYNIDPASIEAAITEKTKAIIPVHLYGQVADMDAIMDIARKHSLFVIEDACQSIGAEYKGKKAGSFGDTGCFSFYPTKNLGGVGDGGMIVTNNPELGELMKIMTNHGMKPVYHYRHVGGNFRLDAVQAAALLVKLPHLEGWSAKRRENAAYYNEKFAGSVVQTPYVRDDCVSIYHQYVIRVPSRDELFEHMKSKGVASAIFYPIPLHLNDCFRYLGTNEGSLPIAEKAAKEVLALPVFPEMTQEMLDEVVNTVLEFYS